DGTSQPTSHRPAISHGNSASDTHGFSLRAGFNAMRRSGSLITTVVTPATSRTLMLRRTVSRVLLLLLITAASTPSAPSSEYDSTTTPSVPISLPLSKVPPNGNSARPALQ